MTTVDRSLLQQAQQGLAIRDVYFEQARAEVMDGFDPTAEDEALSVQFKTRVVDTRRVDDGEQALVRIVADCGMRLIGAPLAGDLDQDAATQEEKALISARLVAEYLVVDEVSDPALAEFAQHNGTFHAWPFWREYVHSTCARLRIPVVPVPMYTLARPPGPPALEDAATPAADAADADSSK